MSEIEKLDALAARINEEHRHVEAAPGHGGEHTFSPSLTAPR